MPRADLTIRITGLTTTLRADEIRTDTLTTLAAAMASGSAYRTELINLLDELGQVVTGRAREGEADALIGDLETVAAMGTAEVLLSRADLRQLARESADACNTLTPKAPPAQVRGEAA
jgi:hypothetical protein